MSTVTERRGGAVVTLRASARRRLESAPPQIGADRPPWVPLGRADLLALMHGFSPGQGWAWLLIVAESLADGTPTMPLARCKQIAGRHWEGLWITAQRRRVAEQIGDQIRIVLVDALIAEARAAGCDTVMARSAFTHHLPALLKNLVNDSNKER